MMTNTPAKTETRPASRPVIALDDAGAVPFDPYHRWLGISPKFQPANHYRLLGIQMFEHDPEVIENAADQRMAYVRTFQMGKHSDLSQKLLNELAAARLCLLDPRRRAAYDERLRPPVAVEPPRPTAPEPDAEPADAELDNFFVQIRQEQSPLADRRRSHKKITALITGGIAFLTSGLIAVAAMAVPPA
jgi:hypothetical protein